MVGPQFTSPASADQREGVVNGVVKPLAELVGGNPGIFVDRPGFIAGGGPDNLLSNAVRAISQLNCRRWAAADKSNFSSRVNQGNADLCSPYLDSIGEKPDDGSFGPPFEGGQCDRGYGFVIQAPAVPANPLGAVFANRFTRGPIIGWRVEESGGQTIGYVTSNSGPVNSCAQVPPAQGIAEREWFRVTAQDRGDFTGSVFQDCAGSGGNSCGNPPTAYKPPDRVTPGTPAPPSITVDIPGIGPVNVGLTLNVDGDPVICIGPDACVTVPIGEDDGGDGDDGGGGGPGDPTDPGSPGDGGDTGDGGDAEGEGDEDEELVGLLVQVLSAPGNANVFDNNQETVYRGIGYVRMGFPNRLGTDISGGTVISPQFFHAQQRGLTAWAVNANVGFNLRVTPYYRDISE